MNIVFFGTSGFAVPALERLMGSGHKVLGVVTQPDRPAGRGQDLLASPVKEVALAKNLYLFQPENCNDYEFMRELRALSPDVIIVVAYGQKLGNEILTLARFQCLNIHPSLLPRYRGAEPVSRALMNGETHTGVCIVKVVEKMDAGPILGVTRVAVPPEATTPELEDQLSVLGAELLVDVLAQVEKREALEIPQDEREATYAKRFEKADGKVDWRKTASKVHHFVRALIPWPCAFTLFNGKTRVILWKVKPNRWPQKPPADHRPGNILSVENGVLTVATADGDVQVLELQPESKRKMAAAEFINGYQPKPGMFFA